MKLHLAVAGMVFLLASASCHAITLKLDPQIELLVLDGRKIAGSLLKGADSLELEQGQHQFLFRIDRSGPNESGFLSAPMIVTFTATSHSVAITLPALNTRREHNLFNTTCNFRLTDERGQEIASVRDRLPYSNQSDLALAMSTYNLAARAASVPRFAARETSLPDAAENPDFAWQDASDLPSLQRWFKRLDAVTRQKLLGWMKNFRTS